MATFKLSEIKDPKVRERILAHLSVAGLVAPKPQPNQIRALERKPPARKGREKGVLVIITIVPFVGRCVDEDNYGHSQYKSVRDEIAKWFAIDDGDKRLRFEYAPPVVTRGRTGTMVNFTLL